MTIQPPPYTTHMTIPLSPVQPFMVFQYLLLNLSPRSLQQNKLFYNYLYEATVLINIHCQLDRIQSQVKTYLWACL